ncbi:hypothetical protein [Priestia filamentosa]|uniref:hypothetical protein n=1 Tax=Priestia filamentosa TaxID=1402861 RepID=UPI00234AB862|nr:hypothetical protein [Priestia filamentosa]WCM14431.1 hypothetical protein PGN40_13845 [Priestia filamentosa]
MREYLDEKNPIVLYHTMRTIGDYLVYDEKVLEGLKELSLHTCSADKLSGHYKIGHLAMVTLQKLAENIEGLASYKSLDEFKRKIVGQLFQEISII